MAKLVGVDHRVDHPDHAIGDVELEQADHEPFGVLGRLGIRATHRSPCSSEKISGCWFGILCLVFPADSDGTDERLDAEAEDEQIQDHLRGYE
jgi:hypothetical protein